MHLPVFSSLSGVQIGMPFRTWSGSLSSWVPVHCSCRGALLMLSSMLRIQRGTVVCWWRAQTLENHLHENLTFHHFLPMWASVFYPWNEAIPMTCLKAYCEDWMHIRRVPDWWYTLTVHLLLLTWKLTSLSKCQCTHPFAKKKMSSKAVTWLVHLWQRQLSKSCLLKFSWVFLLPAPTFWQLLL